LKKAVERKSTSLEKTIEEGEILRKRKAMNELKKRYSELNDYELINILIIK